MQAFFKTLLFCLCSFCAVGQPGVYSVENTHSHNDYEQKVPFFTAYKAGFGSIEADIFLVDNKLIVAHDSAELLKHRTLESLYLIPLLTATQNHYGFVYGDSSKVLQMLIDIKTDSIKTLDRLVSILKSMPELSNNRSIRWVISGNRPDPSLFSSYPSFIHFDGVLSRDYSPEALSRISMMSDDFEYYSGWKGEGPIPAADLKVLQAAVLKSHALHKPVRFWDAPDDENAWTRLMQLRVDFINTDHIQELAEFLAKEQSRALHKPVIIGYVGGFRGLAETSTIDARRLSHINYAFVDIKDNRAWLHNEKTDTINFRNLILLKAQNPDLKILISVGGWTWSKHFSDAVLTDTATRNFAQSAVDIVARYRLDGIDIDWEYPGMMGDSNTYRQEDKEHYTNLFKDLRQMLDSLGRITGKTYFVTTAVGGSAEFNEHTQMNLVQLYTDYINVMSYDYDENADSLSSHHTNLFTSAGYDQFSSADKSIQDLIKAGVPPEKIVMGVAFYGKGRLMASADNNGLYRKIVKTVFGGGFTYLNDSLADKKGFVRHWDPEAKAPYLFNAARKIFITYDDPESVKYKCEYVKQHGLAGTMFWEYSSDPKGYLLKVMADEFGYAF